MEDDDDNDMPKRVLLNLLAICKSSGGQITIGASTGWLSGYIFKKLGKVAIVSLAGGVALFQIGLHTEFIIIDWSKINSNFDEARQEIDRSFNPADRSDHTFINDAQDTVKKFAFIGLGFACGFATGVAL